MGMEDIPRRPSCVRLLFAVHEPLEVPLRLVADLGLRRGEPVSASDMRQLEAAQSKALYMDKSLRYLRLRPRTKEEVRRYLVRLQCPVEVASDIVDDLQSLGYVNDADYARQYILAWRERASRREISWKLKQRGIAADVMESVWRSLMQEDDRDDEREAALAQARRMWSRKRNVPPSKRREQVGAALQRKGFPASLILRVLNQMDSSDDG
ncbi:hypothetical protein GCM10025857_02620 [Alicyclobacillus contaminans]|nr:hypothetical protein GCM10025857_02620 [Alicyclobacillus contaminans]